MPQQKESQTNLVVVSDKYGVVESKLVQGFETGSESIEKKYKIENIPQEVIEVCQELERVGARALLVGGSVRDAIISQEHPEMKLKPKDFDLEVYGLSAEELRRVLTEVFGADKFDDVGKAFGIIKVKIDGWDEPLDFSIPRVDSQNNGGGHKDIEVTGVPGMKIREAAARRDITVNSMAYDPLSETVYDPFGGIVDIKEKIIRFTDREAFQEDPLRVIRVMQFAARFGFQIAPELEELCAQMVQEGKLKMRRNTTLGKKDKFESVQWDGKDSDGFLVVSDGMESFRRPAKSPEVPGLPAERIAEELYKLLLKGKKPSLGFEFARRIRLVDEYWPELGVLVGKPQEKEWHPEGDVWTHSMQVMDVMVEIVDRELTNGSLPTPDMWQELDKMIEKYVIEKEKNHLLDFYTESIRTVDPNLIVEIERVSRENSELVAQNHIQGLESRTKRDGGAQALEIIERQKSKWEAEASAIALGVRQKEYRRLVEEKIRELTDTKIISPEKMSDISQRSKEMAFEDGANRKKSEEKRLKDDLKITLILAALCHDLGKATTTETIDGKIRSRGHEQAGVEPMRRIASTLYETRFSSQVKRMLYPLIAEHLKPPEVYRDIKGIRSDEDEAEMEEDARVQKEKNPRRRLTRLANRLANGDSGRGGDGSTKRPVYPDGGGTNLYLLGLVAEADQRGRNPNGVPFTTEEMGDKLAWQAWWNERISEMKLTEPEVRVISGDDLLKAMSMEKKQAGAWIKVVIGLVNNDIREGLLANEKDDAIQAAVDYYQRLKVYIGRLFDMQEPGSNLPINAIWERLSKINPDDLQDLIENQIKNEP